MGMKGVHGHEGGSMGMTGRGPWAWRGEVHGHEGGASWA